MSGSMLSSICESADTLSLQYSGDHAVGLHLLRELRVAELHGLCVVLNLMDFVL